MTGKTAAKKLVAMINEVRGDVTVERFSGEESEFVTALYRKLINVQNEADRLLKEIK